MQRRRDTDDPQQHVVYRAEDAVAGEIGPSLSRWRDVEAFVESVLTLPDYLELWPDAPLDVEVLRRSRNATASLAIADTDSILIRDGSWNALTVLHELAHLVVATQHRSDRASLSPVIEPHGPEFVDVELHLVRIRCGFDQYGILLTSFDRLGVRRTR